MILPRFWSKGTAQATAPDGRRIPITVWRGSRASPEEAAAEARGAADRMARRIAAGEPFPDRYTYGDRALREEVVREVSTGPEGEPDAALTRNAYGAVVLNTTRVCFVDVDVEPPRGARGGGAAPGAGARPAVDRLLETFGIRPAGAIGSILDAVLGPSAAEAAPAEPSGPGAAASGADGPALDRLRRWLQAHPEWGVRVYRTSAGLRYLVTHAVFTPGDAASEEAMRAMGADPHYVKLCRVRKSFRARLTPKPWRIGIPNPPHRFPFEGVTEEEEMRAWVRRYDDASQGRATCLLVEALGSGAVHPEVDPILRLHDEETRAGSGLPLA
jgi:hypothetical protein